MLKFFQRRRARKDEAEYKRGYDYAAGCLLRGEMPTSRDPFNVRFSHFDNGIYFAKLDFEELNEELKSTPNKKTTAKNWVGCKSCYGSGGKRKQPCRKCGGTGKIYLNEV